MFGEMGHSFCGRSVVNCLQSLGGRPTLQCTLWVPHESPVVAWSVCFLSGSRISEIYPLSMSLSQRTWLELFSQGPYQVSKIYTFILTWEEVQPSPKACVFCHDTGESHLTFKIPTGKPLTFLEIGVKLSKQNPRKASP